MSVKSFETLAPYPRVLSQLSCQLFSQWPKHKFVKKCSIRIYCWELLLGQFFSWNSSKVSRISLFWIWQHSKSEEYSLLIPPPSQHRSPGLLLKLMNITSLPAPCRLWSASKRQAISLASLALLVKGKHALYLTSNIVVVMFMLITWKMILINRISSCEQVFFILVSFSITQRPLPPTLVNKTLFELIQHFQRLPLLPHQQCVLH